MQTGLFLVLGAAMLNGLFSPARLLVLVLADIWYPGFLPASLGLVLFLSSLLVATFTLMIAGVPAAVYERLSGATESNFISMGIWLAGVLILTAPAVPNMLQAMTG